MHLPITVAKNITIKDAKNTKLSGFSLIFVRLNVPFIFIFNSETNFISSILTQKFIYLSNLSIYSNNNRQI